MVNKPYPKQGALLTIHVTVVAACRGKIIRKTNTGRNFFIAKSRYGMPSGLLTSR